MMNLFIVMIIIGSVILGIAITGFVYKKWIASTNTHYGAYAAFETTTGTGMRVNHGQNNIMLGYKVGTKNTEYKPMQLEDWQLKLIKDAKAKGLIGISLTINNQQTYVAFYKPKSTT